MLYIRTLNVNDDFKRYMECVDELNSSGVAINNIEQMKRCLTNRPSNIVTYVITLDDKIIASATVIFETKLRYQQLCCHIEDVGVHPLFRKKGYGKMIVNHCLMVAKMKNCYKAKLCCSSENVEFYDKLGFEISSNGMEQKI